MDFVNDLLFWLHLVSLAVGGAAVFGIPIIGSKIAGAPPEARPTLFAIRNQLSSAGRGALLLLLISGPLIVWLKYGGLGGFTFWFWVKMALVVVLIGLVVFAGINAKRAEGGDGAAAGRARMIGMAAMITYLAVIGAAVLNFH